MNKSQDDNGNKVLVLNNTYAPLNICTWKRAMKMLFLGKALMVKGNGHKINGKYIMPLIVKLERYVPQIYSGMVLSRKNVYLRDNYSCQYCGRTGNLTIDHIVPKSKGGGDGWENLVACCLRCNNKKGNRTLEESDMSLLRLPYKPPSMLYLHITRLKNVPSSWQDCFFVSQN